MKIDITVLKKTDFIVSTVIALLILAWNLKNSFEFGRLAFVPLYDDVAYFNDAVVRYQKFVNGNVFSLVKDAFSNPPHSPLMAFQAVFSYILLGVEDWAPYLTLVWIPFLVVLLALAYTQDIVRGRWILILYVVTTPLLGASVVEFRPDIGNGILTVLAIVLAFNAIAESKAIILTRTLLASAFFLGAALLLKPSAVIYTIALVGFSMAASLVGLLLTRQSPFILGLKRAVSILIIGMLVSLPYYLVASHSVIEYVYNALVRDKEIWANDMPPLDQALFYLTGQGGKWMLGLHFWAAIASVILFLIFRGKFTPGLRLKLYVLMATTLAGYLVVVLNSMKTQFLGVAFQGLLVCVSFFIFAELIRLYGSNKAYWPVLSSLVLISIFSIQPSGYVGMRDAIYAQDVRRTVKQVNELIRSIATSNDKPKVAFMTFTGDLNHDVVTYDLLKHGISNMKFMGNHFRPKEDKAEVWFGRAMSDSDVVIAATEGTRVAPPGMPANNVLPLTLSLVQKNHDFVLLKSIESGQGSVQIYVRK